MTLCRLQQVCRESTALVRAGVKSQERDVSSSFRKIIYDSMHSGEKEKMRESMRKTEEEKSKYFCKS